jgi:hypothetical protein
MNINDIREKKDLTMLEISMGEDIEQSAIIINEVREKRSGC